MFICNGIERRVFIGREVQRRVFVGNGIERRVFIGREVQRRVFIGNGVERQLVIKKRIRVVRCTSDTTDLSGDDSESSSSIAS